MLKLKYLFIFTIMFSFMVIMIGSDTCCCPAPITNGDFEVASIEGWTQEAGGGYKVTPCDYSDPALKVYGCEGYFALSQMGVNNAPKGVISQVVELPSRCTGKQVSINAKIMAVVSWQSTQTQPGCSAINPAWGDDTIQIKATFLDASNKQVGSELKTPPTDCTGLGDPHVVKPTSGKVSYLVYTDLPSPLTGPIPDGATKIKIEVIGTMVTPPTIDTGVDSVSICIIQ